MLGRLAPFEETILHPRFLGNNRVDSSEFNVAPLSSESCTAYREYQCDIAKLLAKLLNNRLLPLL